MTKSASSRKTLFQFMAAAALVCMLAIPVFAALTGDISGTVVDPHGAAIAKAKVTVRSVTTGALRDVETNEFGLFSVPQLELGEYEITVQSSGFKSYTARAVVRSGENTRLNAQLELGQVSESVTVEAVSTPNLDVATAQMSSSLDSVAALTLPNLGRDPVAFASLSSGVIPVNRDNSSFLGTGSFQSNGSRGRANNITVDNITSSDLSTTGEAGTGTFVLDSIQEFKLISNNFDAEFGRNSGSQVQIITKGGGNQFHGDAYWYYQSAFFNARDFFNTAPGGGPGAALPFVQNQGGFAAGGPVYKDHTFIFGDWEIDKTRGAGGTVTAKVLTPTQAAGITDPTMKALFAQYGSPTSTTGTLVNSAPNQSNAHTWSVRVDQLLRGGKDQMFVRYGQNPAASVTPGLTFPSTNLAGFGASVSSDARDLAFGYTTDFSSSLINQFRFGFGRSNPNFVSVSPFPLGPFITISGLASMGESNIIPQGRTQNTFQYGDTVSKVMGRHTFKFGGDALRYQSPSVFDSNVRSTFAFGSIAAFLAGTPSSFTENVGNSHRHNFALDGFFFGQDDFRVTNTITLNLGFRLESSGGVSEGDNILSNLDPNNNTPIGLFGNGPLGGVDIGGTAFHRNWNPAPRLGIAWNPGRGKWVVRSGYGIAYDYIFLNPITNLRFSAPFLPSLTIQSGQFTGGNTVAALAAGTAPAQTAIEAAASAGKFLATQANFGTLSPVSQNLANPRNQQANLGVEYQAMKDMVVKVTGVATWNDHLQTTVPLNLIQPGLRPAPATSLADQAAREAQFESAFSLESGNASGTVVNDRLDPRFNSVNQVQSVGVSTYRALELEAIKKFAHGLSFDANYTWSHSIDDTSDVLGVLQNDVATPLDPTKPLSANESNSAFDIRQRFVMNYVYKIPFTSHLTGYKKVLLDGWEQGGIFATQTGEPITLLSGGVSPCLTTTSFPTCNAAGATTPITDVLLTGNSTGVVNGNLSQIVPGVQFNPANAAAVSQPLLGNDGNSGRNHLRLAGLTDFDLSMQKSTKITEGKSLLLRWEAFNVLNHPNLSRFQNTLSSNPTAAGFATYQGTATTMRQMQVSAKFLW